MTEWAEVHVDKGGEAEAARALLALADHPREVVWQPGKSSFMAPDSVAEKYRKSLTAPKRRPKKESNDG